MKDYYLKPQAIKPKTCYIDHLRIEPGAAVDKFEQDLCEKVRLILVLLVFLFLAFSNNLKPSSDKKIYVFRLISIVCVEVMPGMTENR